MENSEADKKLLSIIHAGNLTSDIVVEILKRAHGMDDHAIEAGNSFLPSAGDFLFWDLRFFIKAEISNDTALAIINHRKAIIRRLCLIFPTILDLLEVADDEATQRILNQVYDVAVDFEAVSENRKRAYNFKRIRKKIDRLQSLVKDLNPFFNDHEISFGYEFEEFYRNYKTRVHKDINTSISIDEFQKQFEIFAAYLEIFSLRFDNGEDAAFIRDSKATTYIVENAYDITNWHNGPAFVTTPGSDFSFICSLIFEVATGISNESLAGAINRFARSEEKAEIDREEQKRRAEESDDDNFLLIKEKSQKLRSEIVQLSKEMENETISMEAKLLIACTLEEKLEAYKSNENAVGPFIVWASQLPESYWERYRDLSEIGVSVQSIGLKLDIAEGEAKRKLT